MSVQTECTPEEVGLDASRLAKIAPLVVDRFVKEGAIPFGHLLIARHGKVCYQYKSGCVNIQKKKQVQDNSMFRIYSMTKPLTSVTLMTLHEEGMFKLTDPLSDFLPEFAKEKLKVYTGGLKLQANGDYTYNSIPCTQDITIQMLLTHTSGLSYGFDGKGMINPVDRLYHAVGPGSSGNRNNEPDIPLDEFVRELAKMPLVCQPGTQWNYSLSVDVQGRLIEVRINKRNIRMACFIVLLFELFFFLDEHTCAI